MPFVSKQGKVTSQDVTNIIRLTQAEYDAIVTPDPDALYIIIEEPA